MDTNPDISHDTNAQLESYFTEVTKGCNAFRILLIGKAGSGKSTLVCEVFDLDEGTDNISHYTPGEHDINDAVISPNNPSLILHDSKGIETGSVTNLNILKKFIRDRRDKPFHEQLHAIWFALPDKYEWILTSTRYCVEIPVSGGRLFEIGDLEIIEDLRKSDNKVPVIIVFTKLDKLEFNEMRRIRLSLISKGVEPAEALARAKIECIAGAEARYHKSCIQELQRQDLKQAWSNYCVVSNRHPETILNLVELTKAMLTESEALTILWAQAQMLSVDTKVNLSLRAARNTYRLGLFASLVPLKAARKLSMLSVLSALHADIVRIWNIYDPDKILVGANMRTMIRQLFMEPTMRVNLDGQTTDDDENFEAVGKIVAAALNPMSLAAPAVVAVAQSLDVMLDTTPAAARVLMAYITDLTLGLESLYWVMRPKKDQPVTDKDIIHAFTKYSVSQQRWKMHSMIRDFIGDENIIRSFQRDKVLAEVSRIVSKGRAEYGLAKFLRERWAIESK